MVCLAPLKGEVMRGLSAGMALEQRSSIVVSDQGAMWSNEIEKKPAGYAKSCGPDFYDMPELNGRRITRKNDVSKVRKF